MLGTPELKYDVKFQQARLEASWIRYRERKTKHNLLRAILRTYRREYITAMLWFTFVACLQLTTPFLLRRLILFVQYQEEDTIFGISLVAVMVLI